MPTKLTPCDPLIDTLVADLRVVRPRRWAREAALLALLVMAEIGVFVLMRGVRPDMHDAMATMPFWWKSGSLAIIGGIAVVAALISLDPATTTARRLSGLWWALAVCIPILLASGWLLDAGAAGRSALLARLEWRDGLDCLSNIGALSLPPMVALGLLMRRGAPTQPGAAALAAGLAAAGLGAFVFSFHCDHDDPLYVTVWYGGAVIVVAGLARLILPRLARW